MSIGGGTDKKTHTRAVGHFSAVERTDTFHSLHGPYQRATRDHMFCDSTERVCLGEASPHRQEGAWLRGTGGSRLLCRVLSTGTDDPCMCLDSCH